MNTSSHTSRLELLPRHTNNAIGAGWQGCWRCRLRCCCCRKRCWTAHNSLTMFKQSPQQSVMHGQLDMVRIQMFNSTTEKPSSAAEMHNSAVENHISAVVTQKSAVEVQTREQL